MNNPSRDDATYVQFCGPKTLTKTLNPLDGIIRGIEISSATTQYANPIDDCFRTLAATIDKIVPLPFADEDAELSTIDFLYDSEINTGHALTDAYHSASHYL